MLQFTKLTQQVLEAVFEIDGKVFGGFVRDMLAGDVPNDIDIRLGNPMDVPTFLLLLVRFGTVTITGGAYYDNLGGLKAIVATSGDDPESVKLDITWCPSRDVDVDVNHLTLSRQGIVVASIWQGHLSTLDNIAKRQFWSDFGCSEARIQKMLDKGWKWLNDPFPQYPLKSQADVPVEGGSSLDPA